MKACFKIFSAIVLIGFASFLFYSCKKTEKDSNSLNEKQLQDKIAKTKQWLITQPKLVIHPVNQKIENFQVDEHGNKIPFGSLKTNSTGPGCSPISNPSVNFDNWFITDADCIADNYYQVGADFTISSENAVVYDNPNNTTQHTLGRILIRNASNVLIFSKEDIPVTITDIGPDPNNYAAELYKVSWLTTSLPSNMVNGSYSMRLGIYYYTECEEESRYSYAPLTNWFHIGESAVCNTVAPVFLDPSGHSVAAVSACSCCNPEIVPSAQKLYFSRSGFTSSTKTMGVTDIWFPTTTEVPQGYTYTVTYWNVGSDGCEGPTYSKTIYW